MKYLINIAFFLLTLSLGLAQEISVPENVADQSIDQRLTNIVTATDWYPELDIEVREGLVILKGKIDGENKKKWVTDVASKLEGVIAVIDESEDSSKADSVLSPAQEEISEIVQKSYRLIPYIVSSLFIILLAVMLAYLFRRLVLNTLKQKNQNVLLRQSIGNAVGLIFFLLGLYFALKSSGLSGLAVTVLGGTGFLGIGIGLALKGTFENYASGLMISLRELFRRGELIQIDDFEGVVQSVTTQATTIIDYSGNSIIIPNTQVVNSVIKNITRNPLMRTSFGVGISYDDTIDEARKVILEAVAKRLPNLVIQDPPAIVVVESLGAATVNLRIYFWFDASKLSLVRATSSVIEVVKEALMAANISMPDDAREIVFASPLRIEREEDITKTVKAVSEKGIKSHNTSEVVADSLAENDIEEIKKIAHSSATVDKGEDLLK